MRPSVQNQGQSGDQSDMDAPVSDMKEFIRPTGSSIGCRKSMRLILGDFCEENKQTKGRGRAREKKETIQTNIQSRTIGRQWERAINVA